MAYTYSKIASVTVGSGGSSSIDFIAIPQNYTDLLVKFSGRSTQNDFEVTDVQVLFNNSSSSQTQRNLRASSITGVISQTRTDILLGNMPSSTNTSNTFSNSEIYIPNYTGSNFKSVSVDGVVASNTNSGYYWWLNLGANLWSSTAAITSIKLIGNNGSNNFAQYSTATLYGIKAEV